jgi:hypothetical protein
MVICYFIYVQLLRSQCASTFSNMIFKITIKFEMNDYKIMIQ